jgi:hypothetical protein
MATLEPGRLATFGKDVRSATTGDVNDLSCEQLRQFTQTADQFIVQLREAALSVDGNVDPVSRLEDARDSVASAYERVTRVGAMNAPVRNDADAPDAYSPLLTEVAALLEKLNTLCLLTREQEADQDKTLPGEFTDPDDLFAAMGV